MHANWFETRDPECESTSHSIETRTRRGQRRIELGTTKDAMRLDWFPRECGELIALSLFRAPSTPRQMPKQKSSDAYEKGNWRARNDSNVRPSDS
jgi:hypothetical protein